MENEAGEEKPKKRRGRIPGELAPDGNEGAFDPENWAGIPGSKPVTDKGASVKKLRPKKLSHRLKYVSQLAAMGLSGKEIAERTGYTQHRISVVLNSPLVSNEVELTRRHVFERDPEMRLKSMLPKALGAIDEVLNVSTVNFKEQLSKADIGFRLLERTHGKPKQSVELGSGMLSDLFRLLDARDAAGQAPLAIPAESRRMEFKGEHEDAVLSESTERGDLSESPIPSSVDPLDEFVNLNFPAHRKDQGA